MRLRFRFSPAARIFLMRATAAGSGRMADEGQSVPSDKDIATAESTPSAVAQLFRDHNRILVRYLAVRLQSTHEANEVAQEAYARLLRLHRSGTPSLLRAYLFKVATNIAIDRLRHRKIQRQTEEQSEV